MPGRFSGSVDRGWEPYVVPGDRWHRGSLARGVAGSGGRWHRGSLAQGVAGSGGRWLRGSLALAFLACLRCSAAAVLIASQVAAPLYREEHHTTRSFVQGGAPLNTVLCTGRSASQHGPEQYVSMCWDRWQTLSRRPSDCF